MRFLLLTTLLLVTSLCSKPSFYVDWDNDRFVKDGETWQYVSGSMHYFRIPHQYWAHRISAAKSAGLNAVTTYVAWNQHEPTPGDYKFTGQQDLIGFIEECGKQGMPVLLRVGPYICAEWDYGGIPAWVMNIQGMTIRSNNEPWLKAVQSWLNVLLPMIKPHLYNNGGNIIMLQVENEYGAFGCDHVYISKLQSMFLDHLDAQIFTTDGNRDVELDCGKSPLPSTLTTVDFSPEDNLHDTFLLLRVFMRHGPLVNSELYAGWCDYWGQRHQTTEAASLGDTIDMILSMNASVSLYMWHGGSNFGLTSGGEVEGKNPTSYDYDAPQSEWGDVKLEKYWAIRNATSKHFGENKAPVPVDSKKWDGGVVKLSHAARLVNLFQVPDYDLGMYQYPRSMESLGVYSGVIAYVHKTHRIIGSLVLSGIRDRAYLMVDGVYAMVAKQGAPVANNTIIISSDKSLIIFVENMGHTNYGPIMKHNHKGLLSNVTLDGVPLEGWQHYWVPVVAAHRILQQGTEVLSPLDDNENMSEYLPNPFLFNMKPLLPGGPTIFYAMFQGNPDKLDTFLDVTGWSKGFATLNDHDLGRYWPDAGPQYTLYVPGVYFMTSYNVLTLTEMQSSFKDLTITFTTVPRIDGPFDPNA